MAVPPAPDGDAVGDPSDSNDTSSSDSTTGGRSFSPRVLRAVLVAAIGVIVVSVALAAVFVFVRGDSVKIVYDDPADTADQRDEVLAAAQSFVTVFSDYGPDDLDEADRMPGYVERVEKLLTAKFATTFEQNVTFAEQTVAQQQVTRTAQVFAVGVSRLEDDSARVLVAGTDRVAIPDPDEPEQLLPYSEQTFRYEVDLVLTQGEWLVDDFGPVGTLDQPDPEDLPTAPSPEGTQGSQGGEAE